MKSLLTILLLTTEILCDAAPFNSAMEKIPPVVAQATLKQRQHYLGTNDGRGIPLFDTSVDWNWFTNWPDQFGFQGSTYRLSIMDISGGDYFIPVTNRAAIKQGTPIFARYGASNNVGAILSVSAAWRADGSVSEKVFDIDQKRVFGYHFYPSGQLYFFARDDAVTKDYSLEYFDKSGKLVGVTTSRNGKERSVDQWRGQRVDEETFRKRTRELYQSHAN